MKKLYLLGIAGLMAGAVAAQSQRFMVAEAFSNASCGPCAQQNPGYNTLLNANTTKVVGIKYQASFPGYDPMNQQNPSEVSARQSYYGVSGVPHGVLDGTAHTGNSYTGALANLTQSKLNTRYAVPSPFDLQVTHQISPDLSTVNITVNIRASQNLDVGSNTLKLHVLLLEREITFPSAPGTNGETSFKGVMRKMYPNANGTNLQSAWSQGDSLTLTFTEALPSYIYKMTEVAVVAFIQNHNTKEVLQGDLSEPVSLPDYGVVASISGTTGLNCTGDLTGISATIRNLGSQPLTSAKVNYSVDGGTASSFQYSGNIASGSTDNVNIPNIQGLSGGTHTLKIWLTEINGNASMTSAVGTTEKKFDISGSPVAAPVSENFEATGLPANWLINNGNSATGWQKVQGAGGFGNSNRCMRCYVWAMAPGTTVDLFTPRYDLSGASMQLEFDLAYTYFTAANPENDRLMVDYSTNCGATWNNVYNKSGTALATASPKGSSQQSFIPTASEWRKETVDLSGVTGTDVLFRFRVITDFGDNIYIDNVNLVTNSSSIPVELSDGSFAVYPNPAREEALVQFTLGNSSDVRLRLMNLAGQTLQVHRIGQMAPGTHHFPIHVSDLESGAYIIAMEADTRTEYLRLVVTR